MLISLLRQPPELYIFGKHPAWRDYIDVSVLPPVPRAFQTVHNGLRAVFESAYNGTLTTPRYLIWKNLFNCGALLIQPSRDRGDERGFRRAPLFVGVCARGEMGAFVRFAVPELLTMSDGLLLTGQTQQSFTEFIAQQATLLPGRYAEHEKLQPAVQEGSSPESEGPTSPTESETPPAAVQRFYSSVPDLAGTAIQCAVSFDGNRRWNRWALLAAPGNEPSWRFASALHTISTKRLTQCLDPAGD